jgi:hypothetical protein
MPHAGAPAVTTTYHAVIYLRGTEEEQLDAAERRCRDYAARFGWQVLEVIRDTAACTTPSQILARVWQPGAQILLTDTPDMIAPDQGTRDDLIMTIEGTGYIVHPLSASSRP